MRINRFVASASGLSRRAADIAIGEQRVKINNRAAAIGDQVEPADRVTLDDTLLRSPTPRTILLHKPVGQVTSRRQQGATPTIYSLLPPELYALKPVGRLDKDSSGVLLLTSDGALAQSLQHPSSGKTKRYLVWLDRSLNPSELKRIQEGVMLDDGPSIMEVQPARGHYEVVLQEGRNRQIRRSFAAIGRRVAKLHRTEFGRYTLGALKPGEWRELAPEEVMA